MIGQPHKEQKLHVWQAKGRIENNKNASYQISATKHKLCHFFLQELGNLG